MDRGAWQAIVHRVAKSQIWLKQLSTAHSTMNSIDREDCVKQSRSSNLVFKFLYHRHTKYSTVQLKMLVAQSHLTLCNPVDCSPPSSSVRGISQARILKWVVISFSRGPSWPRDWTYVSSIAGRVFTVWATREYTVYIIHTCIIYSK